MLPFAAALHPCRLLWVLHNHFFSFWYLCLGLRRHGRSWYVLMFLHIIHAPAPRMAIAIVISNCDGISWIGMVSGCSGVSDAGVVGVPGKENEISIFPSLIASSRKPSQ